MYMLFASKSGLACRHVSGFSPGIPVSSTNKANRHDIINEYSKYSNKKHKKKQHKTYFIDQFGALEGHTVYI